ncbi:hypothetical protein ACO0RG_002825 [Hanseniaspora osmophila]|uniref:Transcription initiation factor IIA large subunit n=1 Tax=Hanseniaspora osmophila TaxID=56408 RepID=A0A1E5R7U6_9ASCO|nr:Transcription initiation factor IIA large subunit [Hanseniaspora osmophila]
MSNKEVSTVYESIIENVINEVRVDFENNGVDEDTLQSLKQIWQNKLSESKTAVYSWDTEADVESMNTTNGAQRELEHGVDANGTSDAAVGPDGEIVVKGELKEGQEVEIEINNGGENDNDNSNSNIGNNDVIPKSEDNQVLVAKKNAEELEMLEKLKQEQKDAKKTALLETDEVNSDLDDSDDDYLNSDDEDQEEGNILLCLYDKVGKVRNKWKWSLRDGIATVNNKDYTFKRANGESEW